MRRTKEIDDSKQGVFGLRFLQLALPHGQYFPSRLAQFQSLTAISLLISQEFLGPKRPSCRRYGPARLAVVPVPKAPMNKNGFPPVWEDYVGRSRQARIMYAVAIAVRMKQTTQQKLWGCVPVSHRGHAPRTLLGCKYIRHWSQAA